MGAWLTVEYMDVDGFLRSPASRNFEDALAFTVRLKPDTTYPIRLKPDDVPFRRSGRAERRAWLTRTGRGPNL